MTDLAIHGGEPVRTRPWPPRPPYGISERNAANTVVASGNLSGFLADEREEFYGGPYVRRLEAAWCEKFGCEYAVAMNSGTSCLFAAVQALGIGPGDEVIVTPWSMSASATCVLAAGATPVFADIEPDTYCLDAYSVARVVTPRTKAIVIVDLFGRVPRDMDELGTFGIPIIEDAAQAVGARFGVSWAGTIGEVGVFSLNRHKTLQCGEGGVAVTDDPEVAYQLQLLRNHGEVLGSKQIGYNWRMGEVEAAIAEVQLSRLEELTLPRRRNAERLDAALAELEGLTSPPPVTDGYEHVHYLYAVRGASDAFYVALSREGILVSRYAMPLYELLPLREYARVDDTNDWEAWYPNAARAYREVIVTDLIHGGMQDEDLEDVIEGFRKVHAHREEL